MLRGSGRWQWQWHIVCVLALFHSFRFLLLFSFRASHSPFVLPSRGSFPLSFDKRLTFISVSFPSGPPRTLPLLHMPLYGMKKRQREREREVELEQLSECCDCDERQQIKGAFRASSASSPEHLERINRHIFPMCVRACVCVCLCLFWS